MFSFLFLFDYRAVLTNDNKKATGAAKLNNKPITHTTTNVRSTDRIIVTTHSQ